MGAPFAQILKDNAAAMGFPLQAAQIEQCTEFAHLVKEWNERINLTSLVAPEEMAIKHFVDSFTCLKAGKWPQGCKVVDVGTGAGFPGIPLAILRPDITWVLTDALKKRIDFLQIAVETLGLSQVLCVHARAEELGRRKDMRETCDVAVARAVARLPVLLEYCVPLVRVGGGFLAMKGPESQAEVNEGERAAQLLGTSAAEITQLELPLQAGSRSLIWYNKTRKTASTYPRKPGLPAKSPL